MIRGSDNTTTDIMPLSAGGVANASAQDAFCTMTNCLISVIYDQSGHSNHLTQAPSGGAAKGPDDGFDYQASAVGAPVTLNGQKAYGVFISPGTGYRIDDTNDIATGNDPEGMYNVIDGTHYNEACCFDYGNAERNNDDNDAGHMECVYFGTENTFGIGTGPGPWILSDQENGLFSNNLSVGVNPKDPTITYRFVHGIVKGASRNLWSLRGGNAQSGPLTTYWAGPRADGYYPMSKEGAIILGIGGDNSDGSQGTFYEGAMTSGYPSDAIENQVHDNIVAASYAVTPLTSGPALTAGSTVSIQASGATGKYIGHDNTTVELMSASLASGKAKKDETTFTVTVGNGYSGCFSFESVDTPNSFIRHSNYQLFVEANDGTATFATDSTFCPETALDGTGTSFRSWSYPSHYWRRYNNLVYIAAEGGPNPEDDPAQYNTDVSWTVQTGFA